MRSPDRNPESPAVPEVPDPDLAATRATYRGPSRRIRVEPIRAPRKDHAGPEEAGTARAPEDGHAEVIEEITSRPLYAADVFAVPDFVEPVVAYRKWRIVDGRLRSLYMPVFWTEAERRAECRFAPSTGPGARTAPHMAPDPTCVCGIYASHKPDYQFPTIDFRGVTGVVTVWGSIEVHADGLRRSTHGWRPWRCTNGGRSASSTQLADRGRAARRRLISSISSRPRPGSTARGSPKTC